MRYKRVFGGVAGGIVLGLVLAWLFAIHSARAQESGREVAIAPGPGGMWVVHGDTVRVCIGGAVQAGVAPPTPRCGDATPLR